MSLYLSQERAEFLKGGFLGINWDVNELEEHQKEIKVEKLLKMSSIPAKLGEGRHPFETKGYECRFPGFLSSK